MSAGTPPPNRGLLHFTSTIGFYCWGALLHPLHHQIQQGGHGSLHLKPRHCTRLKVRNAETKGQEWSWTSTLLNKIFPFWTSTDPPIQLFFFFFFLFNNDVNICLVTPLGLCPTAVPMLENGVRPIKLEAGVHWRGEGLTDSLLSPCGLTW